MEVDPDEKEMEGVILNNERECPWGMVFRYKKGWGGQRESDSIC